MKKETLAVKKSKTANELQKKPTVSKTIKGAKEIKTTKPEAVTIKQKKYKEPTIVEFVNHPIAIACVSFFLLFVTLFLWTSILPMKGDDQVVVEPVMESLSARDSSIVKQGITNSGVVYSIRIRYPEFTGGTQSAQMWSGAIAHDLSQIVENYTLQAESLTPNPNQSHTLEGDYVITSSKTETDGEVVSVTLTLHRKVSNTISSNPEDNTDQTIERSYQFSITNDKEVGQATLQGPEPQSSALNETISNEFDSPTLN